ncbi:MAG TPA: potassium transporter TrkG, partial [Tenuifilaceae bacterium]|nr:potassium transporter TrkG [Tenuifilaceae bacterium]
VMLLSTLVIGSSVFLLALFQPNMALLNIVFEVVSAFSTVGLSLGITSSLSVGGKVVIILTMFVGRVGMLTILIGMFKRTRFVSYKYPTENVYIT